MTATTSLPEDLKTAIFTTFESIYSASHDGRHVDGHIACLATMEAFRSSLLDYVASTHSQLRLRLSAASRINQLPIDVLIRIFSAMPFKDLVTATHVCHHWRKTGLETAALWSSLELDGSASIDAPMLLARSKAAPLDVWMSPGWRSKMCGKELIAVLVPHLQRLRSLDIRPSVRNTTSPWNHGWVLPTLPPRQIAMPVTSLTRLSTLRINWDDIETRICLTLPATDVEEWAGVPPLPLREVHILRGVDDIGFTLCCTQLRILVLNIPPTVSTPDVLRVLATSSVLRHVELRLPNPDLTFSRPPSNGSHDRILLSHCIEYLLLGEYGPAGEPRGNPSIDSTDYNQAQALLYLSQIGHSHIRHIDIQLMLGTNYYDICSEMVSCLSKVTVADISGIMCYVLDECGYVRHFPYCYRSPGLFVPIKPPVESRVCKLRISMHDWSRLAGRPGMTFPCLEELFLRGRGSIMQDQPSATCPRLRVLTLCWSGELYLAVDPIFSMGPDAWLAAGVAAAARRVCIGLRLHQLRLLRIAGPDLHNQAYACDFHLPRVIQTSPLSSSSEFGESIVDDFPISESYMHLE